jgi:2-aminoethylphosphonate-pyruvate transaminase
MMMNRVPASRDKTLFTPGPLTTSMTVKQAMLRDLGSRDNEFIGLVRSIRTRLLTLAQDSEGMYDAVLMQGSGTFGVESAVTSIVPQEGKLLVAVNGAYGRRIVNIAQTARIPVVAVESPEDKHVEPYLLARALDAHPDVTTIAAVHHETTTGIMNPVASYGVLARERKKVFIVDAMSSFGGMRLIPRELHIDALISSSNKCIEGVPGFSFVMIRHELLSTLKGRARSLSLDLYAQWEGLQTTGQFRFTPPLQVMMAFSRALEELEQEGGIAAREERYRENNRVLRQGMRRLGFREYLPDLLQGHFITGFLYPAHPRFAFERFYEMLSDRGHVIYPGKLSAVDCFRIGNIGRIFPSDIRALLGAIEDVLNDMGISLVEAS